MRTLGHLKLVYRIIPILERKSERLFEELACAPPEHLHRAPIEMAWSPFKVMQHIGMVERASVDYLLFKFDQDEAPVPQSLSTRLKGKMVVAGLMSPLKFKAPRSVDVTHQDLLDAPTLSDIERQMRGARTDLVDLVGQAPPAWLDSAVYRHPRAGRMSLDDLMLMLMVHHDRHARQIKRGLAQNARDHRR